MTSPFRFSVLRALFFSYSCIIHRAISCDVHYQQARQERRALDGSLWSDTDSTEGPINPHLLFHGKLKNDLGQPVEGAQVQFWHADYNGNYLHPGDDLDGNEYLRDSFSYFGTASTDNVGSFEFKTYRPGIYLSRPVTHIHFKVFDEGRELLTSQFYFSDEDVQMFYDEMLILTMEQTIDDDGNAVNHVSKDVVVNMNMGGFEKLTPWQMEGPFYPLVDFFDVSSDMTLGLMETYYDHIAVDASSKNPTSLAQLSTNKPTLVPSPRPTRRPTPKPSSGPSPRPVPDMGFGGPEFDNLDEFLAFLGEGDRNDIVTGEGNYTVNFGNDTDVDDSELANEIPLELDGDVGEDEESPAAPGNATTAAIDNGNGDDEGTATVDKDSSTETTLVSSFVETALSKKLLSNNHWDPATPGGEARFLRSRK